MVPISSTLGGSGAIALQLARRALMPDRFRIALSVGHGAKAVDHQVVKDPGAVNAHLGVTEFDTCERIFYVLYAMLKERLSVETYITPIVVPLQDRVRDLNLEHKYRSKIDLAVELHLNGYVSPTVDGTECLYCPNDAISEEWAQRLQDALVDELGLRDRGIKEGWYRMDKPGHIDYPGDIDGDEKIDYFLRATDMPAVIVEPCFITCDKSAEEFVNGILVQRTAYALFKGLTGVKDA